MVLAMVPCLVLGYIFAFQKINAMRNLVTGSKQGVEIKERMMKKYLFLIILIVIATMPVFSQADTYVSWFFGIGGGPDVGIMIVPLGIQFGVELYSPFNLLLEAGGGIGIKKDEFGNSDDSDDTFSGLCYQLGGLIEYRIEDIFLLGAGGGVGGGIFFDQYSYFYPYIRGSASVLFVGYEGIKLGLYYDYGFEYGSMFGIRVHLSNRQ